jgi:hypothetical protein
MTGWLIVFVVSITAVNVLCACWMAYNVAIVLRAKAGFVHSLDTFMRLMEHLDRRGD